MLKAITLLVLSLSCSLSALDEKKEYEIVMLASKGKELTTQSAGEIKLADNYVAGKIEESGRESLFIYSILDEEFTLIDLGIQNASFEALSETGMLSGLIPNGWDSQPYLYDSQTDLFSKYIWKDHFDPIIIGIALDGGLYTRQRYNAKSYIHYLDGRVINVPKHITKVNAKGEYIYENDYYGDESGTWFFSPETGKTEIGDVNCQILTDTGYVAGVENYVRAFLWHRNFGMIKINPLEDEDADIEISMVNNLGQVVGEWQYSNDYYRHAFIYAIEKGLIDLGTLGGKESIALSINDHGVVVGNSDLKNHSQGRGFIWDEERGMRELSALISKHNGWKDLSAICINNAGVILGKGSFYGVENYFVLKPL